MNAKQAKRLRRNVNLHLVMFLGERPGEVKDITIRDRSYDRFLVDSTVYDATVNGEKQEGKALNVRLTIGSPRQVYKRVKNRVQANRIAKQSRVLPVIRVRPTEATGAVEHTGAESIQREHVHLSGL